MNEGCLSLDEHPPGVFEMIAQEQFSVFSFQKKATALTEN
jgi:hypothetical protein